MNKKVYNDFLIEGNRVMKEAVEVISWSPNRDLFAIGDCKGTLHLYRLTKLEPVWTMPSPQESHITSICWRPDGTVIAVAYDNVQAGIHLLHMEKAAPIFTLSSNNLKLSHHSVYLKWHETTDSFDEQSDIFTSLSFKNFFSDLPEKEDNDDSYNFKAILDIKRFNLMVSVDASNSITLYAYGIMPLCTISCFNSMMFVESLATMRFTESSMTQNMDLLATVWQHQPEEDKIQLSVQLVDIKKIFLNTKTWNDISLKLIRVVETIKYMEYLFEVMKEHCEDLVHQMETRLLDNIADQDFETSVGDELLHYLVWGTPCYQLEVLLKSSIKENMLERFRKMLLGSNVFFKQTLLSNMQTAADTIYYLFNELKGMNKSQLFPDLEISFDESKINNLIKLGGELCMKTYELLEVYLEHARNFQLFIKWLFISIQQLKRQQSSTEKPLQQLTAKELEEVADFILDSFVVKCDDEAASTSSGGRFNLNRIYQYFQMTPLKKQASIYRDNEWVRLVESSQALSDHPSVIKPSPSRTLAQIVSELNDLSEELIYGITKQVKLSDCVREQVRVVLPCGGGEAKSNDKDEAAVRVSQVFIPTEQHKTLSGWTRTMSMCLNRHDDEKLTMVDVLVPPRDLKDTSVKAAVYDVWFADVCHQNQQQQRNDASLVSDDSAAEDDGGDGRAGRVVGRVQSIDRFNHHTFSALLRLDNRTKMCLMQVPFAPMLNAVERRVTHAERDLKFDRCSSRDEPLICMSDCEEVTGRLFNDLNDDFHYKSFRGCGERDAGLLLGTDNKTLLGLTLEAEDDDDEDSEDDEVIDEDANLSPSASFEEMIVET